MQIDVAFLPEHVNPLDLPDRVVVVFDVLRATTSIAAALACGIPEIRIFPSIDAARSAAPYAPPDRLLCGEHQCLPPDGFDLGNSPCAFNSAHAGRTMLLATTNGTKALIAAESAHAILTGSLVNAAAVARAAASFHRDILLLCAGTGGQIALEDIVGAGAVISELAPLGMTNLASDTDLIALRLFESARSNLSEILAQSCGGRNVIAANLPSDIQFASRLNSIDSVGLLQKAPFRIVPFPKG